MKHKIIVTVEVVIEVKNLDYYPDCKTAEDRMLVDLQSAKDDIYMFIDSEAATITVTGEVL